MKPPRQPSNPNNMTCTHCGKSFSQSRRDQIHCSAKCRKAHSQRARRKDNPVNAATSATKRRHDQVFFDKALRLAEMLYSLPVPERLGFMKSLIDEARSGNTLLREILSNHYLLKAGRHNRRHFHRRCPAAYFTISQAADRYCRRYWGASVRDVVYGRAPEPPTGEVITVESVVTIYNGDLKEVANFLPAAHDIAHDTALGHCPNRERLDSV